MCEECRFDSRHYTVADARGTLWTLGIRWRWMTDGVGPVLLAPRPQPDVWSVVEYAHHGANILEVHGRLLDAWFLDRDFNRMSRDRQPGISRLYASVRRDGVVRPGAPVVIEP